MKVDDIKRTGIQGWVSAAINHKKVIYAVILCVVATGIFGITKMKKDEFPSFDFKQGLVAVVYPGASATQIEDQVSGKLEEILFSFKEVKRKSVRSIITDGICYTYVDLNCHQSMKDQVWAKIKLKLNAEKIMFPAGVLAIVVLDEFSNTSSLLIALGSNDKGYSELQEYADDLCERLRRIPELASVSILGQRDDEIAVTLDRERLSAYAIDPSVLMLNSQMGNIAIPSGTFNTSYTNSPIHITPALSGEKEVADRAVFCDPQGNVVRIKDIATVTRRNKEADSFVSFNGDPCLILSVVMRQNNNIVAFGKEVDRILDEFCSEIPDSVEVSRITDQPKVVSGSIFSFLRDLVISMLVVIFVMLMLFPMKSALIASSGVPVCTAIAIFLMYVCGMELNTVTLAAMIVCLGMIVDDSIITMDGYMGKLEQGYGRVDAACRSAKELFLPTFIATLAICLMFFPMTHIITGYLGDFVKSFPWIILFALMTSLFYAVTVVPSLETRFITSPRQESTNAISRVQNKFFQGLENIYAKGQGWCFRHPYLTIGGGLTAIALGILMFTNTSIQMMPKAARTFFVIEAELQGGKGLDDTKYVTDRLTEKLLEDDRVESVTAFTGTGAPRFTATYTPILPGKEKAQLIINTKSFHDTEVLIKELESDSEFLFPQAMLHIKQMDYQLVEAPVTVTFYASDRKTIQPAADSLKEFLARMQDELKWVHSTADNYRPSIDVRLDSDEASLLGVNNALVSLSLQNSFNGMNIASVWEGGKSIPVNLYSDGVSSSMIYSEIGNQMVPTAIPGISVPLRQVASVTPSWENAILERNAGEKAISVMADMKCGKVQPVAMKKISAYVEKNIKPMLPEGTRLEYNGLTALNKEMMPQVIWSFLAAVAVLFAFLLIHFKKLSLAILTMVTSILCLFGASLGLWIFNLDFGLTAVLGYVSLVGIVVRNGIILYEYAESLRTDGGMSAKEAAMVAGKRRMRPIFLTSCTTALGVLPMIISGDLLWQPMGVVICFGIVMSIALIVLIMPVSYWLIFQKKAI